MNEILKNKYVRIGLSAVNVIYAVLVIWFAVNSFLYEFRIIKPVPFLIMYLLINALFFTLMFLSRKALFTSILSIILLPFVFVIVVMNIDKLFVAIPPLIVCGVIFFVSKNNKTLKTVLTAVFILIYVLGIIAFLIAKMLFASTVENTVLEKKSIDNQAMMDLYTPAVIERINKDTVSPNGTYRYYVVDVSDKNLGRVDVYVEPNNKDKSYSSFKFADNGHERKVCSRKERGDKSVPVIKWVDDDTISYTFEGENPRLLDIEPVKKDYFSFFYE